MPTEDALIYLIENNGKTYFHVLDSDYPNEEVFDYVKSHNIKLDCVTVDCTFGLMREEFGGHMNIWQNVRIKERLEEIGALKQGAKYVLSHISHYCKNSHEELVEIAEKYGMTVAYDGMTIEL
jgi:phosphoribosyl 1,2-cyclic phosphate phosphodiesterase